MTRRMKIKKKDPVAALLETVRRLRAPDGCPWDRDQTHRSLRPFLVEETYEWLDIIDQIENDRALKDNPKILGLFREEAGDVLMQVVLHAQLAEESGATNFHAIAQTLNEKLIRRHPHVFGKDRADSVASAYDKWEAQKALEKKSNPTAGTLDGVPRSLPALLRASRTIEKVTRVGFQWDDFQGPLAKVDEEVAELKKEVRALEQLRKAGKPVPPALKAKLQGELGDVLFTVANVAFLAEINPEDALRTTLDRFSRRFRHVEIRLAQLGRSPKESNLAEMDRYWDEAKELEQCKIFGLTGGIAAGKSTAAKFFARHQIPVVDADLIARRLSEPGQPGHAVYLRLFGTADRAKIREIIFKDSEKKTALEAAFHPLIHRESLDQFLKLTRAGHRWIVYEAALLVETGRHLDLSGLIVITLDRKNRVQRLMKRDGLSRALALKIIANQSDDALKSSVATVVVENTGRPSDLKIKIDALVKDWKSE